MTDGIQLMGAIERIGAAYNEFLKIPDRAITGPQALMLMRIGDREMSVGALRNSGCYLGSNASYNLKKLTEAGLIKHSPNKADARSYFIKLTQKGLELREAVLARHREFVVELGGIALDEDAVVRFAERLPI